MSKRELVRRSRYLSGWVLRYHTWPTITQQTVAHHQWRVATLLIEIFGVPRAELIYYALWHDGGELTAGDPPYPIKTLIPGLREATRAAEEFGLKELGVKLPELSLKEQAMLKVADLVEMHEFGAMEVSMGNTFAEPVMYDTLTHARRIATEYELIEPLNAWISRGGGNGNHQK